MPKLKLISHYLCPYVQRARITLQEKDIEHTIEFIDLSNPPSWFTAISPLGKVPVLLVDEKIALFESSVIMEFLDEITPGSLHPTDPIKRAQNRAWIEFGSEILNNIGEYYSAKDPLAFAHATEHLKEKFTKLEKQLSNGPYFNGDCFSLVDAVFGPIFRYFDVFEKLSETSFFQDLPKLSQWRRHLSLRQSVRHAVVKDYAERLRDFLVHRKSYLSQGITIHESNSP